MLALALVLPAAAQAQGAFKVGFVASDQIITRTPEFAVAQQQLQQQQQTVGTRVRFVQDSLNTVLQTQLADYESFRTSALATAESRRERETGLLQLQGQIEQAEQQGLQYLSYVEARLLQPVLDRVDTAIREEAVAQAVDLVMPNTANNAPVILYRSERVVDMTDAVLRRLGIDPNAPLPTAAPGTARPAAPTAPAGN